MSHKQGTGVRGYKMQMFPEVCACTYMYGCGQTEPYLASPQKCVWIPRREM